MVLQFIVVASWASTRDHFGWSCWRSCSWILPHILHLTMEEERSPIQFRELAVICRIVAILQHPELAHYRRRVTRVHFQHFSELHGFPITEEDTSVFSFRQLALCRFFAFWRLGLALLNRADKLSTNSWKNFALKIPNRCRYASEGIERTTSWKVPLRLNSCVKSDKLTPLRLSWPPAS